MVRALPHPAMRIPSTSDEAEGGQREIPAEVRVWLDKGWTVIPTERRGFVLSGQKSMRGLGKAGLAIGILLLFSFLSPYRLPGVLGIILIVVSILDFRFNTKPPTKFFPAEGEQTRVMDRS